MQPERPDQRTTLADAIWVVIILALALLWLFLTTGTTSAQAQAPTTVAVTGHAGDASNNTFAGIDIQFQLANCGNNQPRIFGYFGIVKQVVDFIPDPATGLITGQIWPNDKINCGGTVGGTFYFVTYNYINVPQGPKQCFVVLSTQNPFNLDTAIPCNDMMGPPGPGAFQPPPPCPSGQFVTGVTSPFGLICGPPGNSYFIQVNGVNLLTQPPANFVDSASIHFSNPSGGIVTAIAEAGITPQVVPPVPGQYTVIYPTTSVLSGSVGPCTESAGASSGYFTNFGPKAPIGSCVNTVPGGPGATFSGFSLPAGLSAGSITSVYAFSLFSSDGVTEINCGGSGGSATIWNGSLTTPLTQISSLMGGMTGANIPTISCRTYSLSSTSEPAGWLNYLNVSAIGLIVYYTGDPLPVDSRIQIAKPLLYNADLNTLGIDTTWLFPASYDSTWTVAQIQALSAANMLRSKGLYLVSDSSDGTCANGGGSTTVQCYWNGTAFSVLGGGVGFPGSGIPKSTGSAWGTSYGAQGTDTNLLTAGTVSGTGASLCTDANGGATTVGCSTASGTDYTFTFTGCTLAVGGNSVDCRATQNFASVTPVVPTQPDTNYFISCTTYTGHDWGSSTGINAISTTGFTYVENVDRYNSDPATVTPTVWCHLHHN